LRKLAPRLYSVASSRKVAGETVDLAVGIIEYTLSGRERIGVGSSFIADRLEEGEKVPVMLEGNGKFRLPDDASVPVIMIGTGTGVSPYRAFLQERELEGATGNWLIFGERNAATDFIYKNDFIAFQQKGILRRLDTAFSRDHGKRMYVTDRIREHSAAFYRWLQEGAHIYLCGNKRTMAPDVRKAIIEVIKKESGVSRDQATSTLDELKSNGRFQEDVY
jgi:sulfite reductase (NADPH) flavoprotein alpha-component